MLEHIHVHRWYLGECQGAEVPLEEAVASWYDNICLPLIRIIRNQNILREFPGRTESDLYLWIIEHQGALRETYGDEVPLELAAEEFSGAHAAAQRKAVKKKDIKR